VSIRQADYFRCGMSTHDSPAPVAPRGGLPVFVRLCMHETHVTGSKVMAIHERGQDPLNYGYFWET
jgi:hypothetical protein